MTGYQEFPEIIDALVTALTEADELSGVTVVDGPVEQPGHDSIAVGAAAAPEEPGLEIASEPADLAGQRDRRTATVRLLLTADGAELAQARRRLYELVDGADAAVRRTPDLGGVVARARLTELAVWQGRHGTGFRVGAEADVEVDTWANRLRSA
ncbi:hypothetical protein [Nocardiopsis ganjiahuensis]|uniref:hypothetical protein n=1 Tax=Nocardiopsis ganjiahuensis TaxID=239984 RepID=UPI0003488B21|nr:hypothetical protein [Nocardiopsis ganjiahuensis]